MKNRKLVVNDAEACIVVEIYRRYLALKSVHALRDELADAGIKSKRRMRPGGAEYGGQTFSRGALYLILQNRLYRGEIPHKGNAYPGEQPAIVDKPLWDDTRPKRCGLFRRYCRRQFSQGVCPSRLGEGRDCYDNPQPSGTGDP